MAIDAPYRSRIAGWARVRKRKLATVAVMVLVVAVTSAVIVARTDSPRFLTVTPRGNFTLDKAELSFGYGTCDIPLWKGKADGVCGLPLDIQNWPACLRSINVTGPPNLDELVTVRGVPAIFSGGYGRLGLTIGTTTVFLSGRGRAFLLEAARSLRGVNNAVASAGKLPQPATRALDETLEC